MEETESSSLPWCPTCRHHHEQGIKCTVCGHTGKSQIFPKMKARSISRRKLSVFILAGNELTAPHNIEFFQILLELRKTVTTISPFDARDNNKFHMLTLIGDLVVGHATVSLTQESNAAQHMSINMLIIENFFVLPSYRQRKLSYIMLHSLLCNVPKYVPNIQVETLGFLLPFENEANMKDNWMISKCISCGFTVHTQHNHIENSSNANGNNSNSGIYLLYDINDTQKKIALMESLGKHGSS